MAHVASDGSKWTNASQARKRSISIPTQPSKLPAGGTKKIAAAAPAPDSPSNTDTQEPAQVVQEHGPANHVEIDHQSDEHSVTSHHEDGHKHHSKHASADEAHDAARQLSGSGAPEGDSMAPSPTDCM